MTKKINVSENKFFYLNKYLENASMKKLFSAIFVFSGTKYMGKSYWGRTFFDFVNSTCRNAIIDRFQKQLCIKKMRPQIYKFREAFKPKKKNSHEA